MPDKIFKTYNDYAINLTKILSISPIFGDESCGCWYRISFGTHTIETSGNKNKSLVMADRELLIAKWAQALN
jgi:hypothetical protein